MRQQIIHDRVMFAPVMEPAFLNGVGPRVEHHGLGAVANVPYSAPCEDLALKASLTGAPRGAPRLELDEVPSDAAERFCPAISARRGRRRLPP